MLTPLTHLAVAVSIAMAGYADSQSTNYPLSLAEAVLVSEQSEQPSVEQWDARADALVHRGEAEFALPDPMVRIGLSNLPLSDFDPGREAMTQTQIGLRQSYPRGNTRALSRARRQVQAEGARAGARLERRRIELAVRDAWLEAFFWQRAAELTRESRTTIMQLGEVALAIFSSGRQNSHDVLRIDVETSILNSRLVEIARNEDTARASLARFVDPANANRDLTSALPVLPSLPALDDARSLLARHPMIDILDSRIDARETEIDLALQQYRPGLAIEGGYGLRDGRSDMASVAVTVEVPLFSRRRQAQSVAAARDERSASELARQSSLLDMNTQLERNFIQYRRLSTETEIYQNDVLERARETALAVLAAYENEQADFAELVRSELALLNAELALTRLRVDALQSHARILYLTGNTP